MASKNGGIVFKVLEFLGAGGQILAGIRNLAERRAEAFAARLGLRMLFWAWISAGLFLSLLGLLEILVQEGVARGKAYAVGGALISLLSLLVLHFARQAGVKPEA